MADDSQDKPKPPLEIHTLIAIAATSILIWGLCFSVSLNGPGWFGNEHQRTWKPPLIVNLSEAFPIPMLLLSVLSPIVLLFGKRRAAAHLAFWPIPIAVLYFLWNMFLWL
jgi:hypothetical protein